MENSNSSGKRDRSGNRNKRNSGISRKNGKNAWLEHKLNRHNKATNSSGVIERHKGSYNLDALKETASYVSQMAYLNALYPPERMESSVNENSAETNDPVKSDSKIVPDQSLENLLLPRSKKKMAVCFGYLGSKYQGLQVNPDAETIEKELERALFLCGGIQESNFGCLQKVQWTRAARTDSGVHAAAQCCAMKLNLPIQQRTRFVEQINSFLPPDIRVHGMTKVSKGFNAKNFCGKRRYHYLLPTYMLLDNQVTNEKLSAAYKIQGPIAGAGYEGGFVEASSTRSLTAESLSKVRSEITAYRASVETLDILRDTLSKFEGTHSFHNFTSGKTSADANASRYILSFACSEPFLAKAARPDTSDTSSSEQAEELTEWVLLSVLGQSFLLNQIRKMVSMAVEVVRKSTTVDTIRRAFLPEKVDIPMAPGLGLYLSELFFEGYNFKQHRAIQHNLTTKQHSAGSSESSRKKQKTDQSVTPAAKTATDNAEIGDDKVEVEGNATDDVIGTAEAKEAEIVDLKEEDEVLDKAADDDIGTTEAKQDEEDEQQNGDDDENEDGDGKGVMFEQMNWHDEVGGFKSKIDDFVETSIHPHIIAQERTSLQFMYFLDYLRTYTYCQ